MEEWENVVERRAAAVVVVVVVVVLLSKVDGTRYFSRGQEKSARPLSTQCATMYAPGHLWELLGYQRSLAGAVQRYESLRELLIS